MKQTLWYFDFISPFAYLHAAQLGAIPCALQPRPVLFAALLNQWGQKGPAEIEGKRAYTYRYVNWLAAARGVPFRMPATHPFNPLPFLRLAIALKCDRGAISTIFEMLYTTGEDPASPELWRRLCQRLDVENADALTLDPSVKNELRRNGEEAIAQGVFGVPTIAVDGFLFWGEDSLPMFQDYLRDPLLFDSAEMRRLSDLRASAERKK